jgi:hypothetical protein
MSPRPKAPAFAVLALATLFAAAPVAVTQVAATEVCVTCSGPDAVYNCTVKNADTIAGLAGDKAIRKICTKILKRSVPHAACSVLKTSSACPGQPKTVGWDDVKEAATSEAGKLDKPGKAEKQDKADPKADRKTGGAKPNSADGGATADAPPGAAPTAIPSQTAPPAPARATATGSAAAPQPEASKAQLKDPPPPKVEPPPGAAKVTSPDTPSVQDGLQGAGDNIKNAAQKTWDCVSSLFGKC